MSFTVSSPSNIAFVKYWGKKDNSTTSDLDRNLPLNPSLSLTLEKARTFTSFGLSANKEAPFQTFLASQFAKDEDQAKVQKHVERVLDFLKLPKDLRGFEVRTKNNFPMGTGLASSASAFSALTLSVLGYFWGRKKLENELLLQNVTLSTLARRGSGSACRSLSGPFVKWDSESASPLKQKDWKLFDTIVIFSKEHKKVPSSEGHKSAQSSPLFNKRLEKIPTRIKNLETSIQNNDLHSLGPLLETEALELHEIARTGNPSIEYSKSETRLFLEACQKIKNREFYFTLDAGPNVHVISEHPVEKVIAQILQDLDLNAEIWLDESGFGPRVEESNF